MPYPDNMTHLAGPYVLRGSAPTGRLSERIDTLTSIGGAASALLAGIESLEQFDLDPCYRTMLADLRCDATLRAAALLRDGDD